VVPRAEEPGTAEAGHPEDDVPAGAVAAAFESLPPGVLEIVAFSTAGSLAEAPRIMQALLRAQDRSEGETKHETVGVEARARAQQKAIDEFATLEPEARTRTLCAQVVRYDGMLLKHVPVALRDKEVCLGALGQNSDALQFVPEALLAGHDGRDLYLEAVRTRGWALADVPQDIRDRTLCMAAVKNDGLALKFVPADLRDREMCLAAVTQDGMAAEYILPLELRKDPAIRSAAVGSNPRAWIHFGSRYA
jgi:hypothetical protein